MSHMARGTRNCRDCEGIVGVSALTCPHCGAERPALPEIPALNHPEDSNAEVFAGDETKSEWSCCSITLLVIFVWILASWISC